MKGKINKSMILLSSLSLFLGVFLLSNLFYKHGINREKELLRSEAIGLETIIEKNMDLIKEYDNPNIRQTILDKSGRVLYDSKKNIDDIHLDRPEILAALESGVGEDTRISQNLEQNSFYHARLLNNGLIFRVSMEINNEIYFLKNLFPRILLVFSTTLAISLFLSNILSNKILSPIKTIEDSMDSIINKGTLDTLNIYDELLPLVQKIVAQGNEIQNKIKDIEKQEDILRTILRNMNEGIVFLDLNLRIVSLNRSSIELLKAKPSNYTNRSFLELNHNLDLYKKLEDALKDKSSDSFYLDFQDRYYYFSISPVFHDEVFSGIILFIMDYSNKYALEKKRREFAANVSHELKTPLTSINGYAELLEQGLVDSDDISNFGSIIKDEGNRLLNMIDSIIKISKIENEEDEIIFEEVSLDGLAKKVINRLSFLAENKNIEIEANLDQVFIKGNPHSLEELFYNLIDNSIKYTEDGGMIRVSVFEDENFKYVEVQDNGLGIPLEKQDRIFERFFVLDKSRNKKTQSTGLGLSIVKHIVEYHNGSIKLNSTPNKGTTITVLF